MGEGRYFPIGSLVIGLCFGVVLLSTWLLVRPPPPPAGLEGILRGEFRPIGSFLLSSRDHGPISEASLRGKWSFLFFGYTACPDVCPNTLHELGRLWSRMRDERGAEPADAQVIFVSVDPARDTPERLANYVAYFDPAFIGATAGRGQIDRLARQFGAGYRLEAETAPGRYNVAHSGAIFLVDPLGRLVATFSQPHYAATIHAQFRLIEAYFSGSAVAPVAVSSLAERPHHEGDDQQQVEGEADAPECEWRSAVVDRRGRRGFGLRTLRVVHGVAV